MNAYETALALTTMARAGEDGTVDSFAHSNLRSVQEHLLPKTGFYVGGVRPSLVISNIDDFDRGDLAWFIGGTESRYFGVWTDKEDGKIYFDAVDWIDNAPAALNLAFSRNEIAVWDIENGEEIRVNQSELNP